jgi:hypothetical protein
MLVRSKQILEAVQWDGKSIDRFRDLVDFSIGQCDPSRNTIAVYSNYSPIRCCVLSPGDFIIFGNKSGRKRIEMIRRCSEKEFSLLYEEIKE